MVFKLAVIVLDAERHSAAHAVVVHGTDSPSNVRRAAAVATSLDTVANCKRVVICVDGARLGLGRVAACGPRRMRWR